MVDLTTHTPSPDPLIDEVRAVRKAVSEEFDHDLTKHFKELQRIQAQHPQRVVRIKRRSAGSDRS